MRTREMLQGIRMCTLEAIRNNIPFCCAMSRGCYEEYFDSEIMYALPWDYVGIIEEHADWYYHCTRNWATAEKIVVDGVLRVEFTSEDNSLGKGIYTFPCRSGRIADAMGSCIIKFKTNQKHVHVVNVADNTNKPLGECVFFEDVILESASILSIEEAEKDSINSYFNCSDVMQHYYGSDLEKPLLRDLPDFLMEKVINKPSSWVEEEKAFSNYDRKTYEGMIKRIKLYEMQKEDNMFDSFYHSDLDFFKYHAEKALEECGDDDNDENATKTMNLF